MESVRWGVLGTARIAREQVIPGIRRSGRGDVLAGREGDDPDRPQRGEAAREDADDHHPDPRVHAPGEARPR